jgi:hypothetical protein
MGGGGNRVRAPVGHPGHPAQSRLQALDQAYGYIAMGTNQESIAEGQKAFSSGQRIEWRLR